MANVKNYTLDEFPIDIYFQKSSKFLFPLLKHKGEQIKPIQTYLAWDGEVGINEYKLVCLYEMKMIMNLRNLKKRPYRQMNSLTLFTRARIIRAFTCLTCESTGRMSCYF